MLDNSDTSALEKNIKKEQNKDENSENDNSPFGVSSSDDEEQENDEEDEEDFNTELDNL